MRYAQLILSAALAISSLAMADGVSPSVTAPTASTPPAAPATDPNASVPVTRSKGHAVRTPVPEAQQNTALPTTYPGAGK